MRNSQNRENNLKSLSKTLKNVMMSPSSSREREISKNKNSKPFEKKGQQSRKAKNANELHSKLLYQMRMRKVDHGYKDLRKPSNRTKFSNQIENTRGLRKKINVKLKGRRSKSKKKNKRKRIIKNDCGSGTNTSGALKIYKSKFMLYQ